MPGGSPDLSDQTGDSNRESLSRPITTSSGGSAKEQTAGNTDSDPILPVSRWTIVSQDNKLLTYLIDLFWTWDGTLSHLIDRELFVSGLSSARPTSSTGRQRRFCSPFLVNAILAVTSLHATRKHPDSYSGDIVTLGHKFASHAFELLESEKGVSSLTLLQGAAVLWLFSSNEGSRASRAQCASLESLLQDTWLALGLETGGSALFRLSGKDDAHDVKIWQAVSHITWGFYCFFAATYDFVALKLLFSYTSHACTDLFDGRNAASLQVLHASSLMTNLWIYRGIYTIKHEYWAAEYCSFVAHALLPRLETDTSTPAVHDIIGRACCVLNEMARAGVSGRAEELLAGVEERARTLKMRVPSYGRKSATHESVTPMVLIRGVQVFDGAKGGMLDPENGTYTVRFGETIEHVWPEGDDGGRDGGKEGDDVFVCRPPL
ncbi:C6 transcription factor [Colletotrichum incanum]|nr:C6 transcription factor [Colletotrichum incanum]